MKGKEDRIRASYREGIDTLEEYKENKALIAKERDSLERQLAELEENTPDKIPDDPTPKMLDRVSSVHDILVSDSYSLVQKNEALKQIIDKIVYDRESDTLKFISFIPLIMPGNPRILRAFRLLYRLWQFGHPVRTLNLSSVTVLCQNRLPYIRSGKIICKQFVHHCRNGVKNISFRNPFVIKSRRRCNCEIIALIAIPFR